MEDDINSSIKISSKETKNNQKEEDINTYKELKKVERNILEKDIKNNKLNNCKNLIGNNNNVPLTEEKNFNKDDLIKINFSKDIYD